MRCINLIPNRRQEARRRKARARMWVAIGSVYGCIVFLAVLLTRVVQVFDDRALASELNGLASQIEKSEETAKSLREELKRARTMWETSNIIADQADWSLLLALMGDCVGSEVVLKSFQMKPEAAASQPQSTSDAATARNAENGARKSEPSVHRFAVSISGLGRSQTAVSDFLVRLEQLGLFDQVRLIETRREPFLEGEAVGFRVNCSLGETAPAKTGAT